MDADENKDGQDTSSETASQDKSSPSTQKPSEDKEKTFTQKEVDTLIATRHSKLDSTIAKLEKQLERSGKTVAETQKLRDRVEKLEKERDDLELRGADDSPDLQEIIKRRRDLDARERELSERESVVDAYIAEFEDDLDNANELGKADLAGDLADEFKVDAKTILSFPSETPEQMRDIAKRLADLHTGKTEGEKTLTGQKGDKPDSGGGAGAGVKSEDQRLKSRYPSMFK